MNRLAPFLSEGSPPGQRPGGLETVKKAAKTLFREKPYAGWSSTPSGKVGPPCARSVISDAYVAGNDGIKFYSVACGRRNSLQEGFFDKLNRGPRLCAAPGPEHRSCWLSLSLSASPPAPRPVPPPPAGWPPDHFPGCPTLQRTGSGHQGCQTSSPVPSHSRSRSFFPPEGLRQW